MIKNMHSIKIKFIVLTDIELETYSRNLIANLEKYLDIEIRGKLFL